MKKTIIILITLATLLQAKVQVCVSILPQAFFVQKIAEDLVDIEVLVKPGSSPATYTPKPSQLKTIADSKLYFTIGVAFEQNWLPRFKSVNQNIKIIDTTKNIQKIAMQSHNHEEDEQEHHGLDPHVWLNPQLVISQVDIITDALIKEDSKNSKIYEKIENNL
jgi:zinc transport system substrate-binding protein